MISSYMVCCKFNMYSLKLNCWTFMDEWQVSMETYYFLCLLLKAIFVNIESTLRKKMEINWHPKT
jgi:hypothetical protein